MVPSFMQIKFDVQFEIMQRTPKKSDSLHQKKVKKMPHHVFKEKSFHVPLDCKNLLARLSILLILGCGLPAQQKWGWTSLPP